jgi:lysyl-tRNA synthetase class 2
MPSSVIAGFRYFSNGRMLEITFQSGRVYRYLDVPPALAEALRQAPSKGEFFNVHIRDRFAFERIMSRSERTGI